MIRQQLSDLSELYLVKKYAKQFNVPRRVVLTQQVAIVTDTINQVDLEQMKRTFTRIETESMHLILQAINYYRIPFEKMLVFNQGKEFVPFDKKKGEYQIPAIIHQAWLGGKLPPVKEYLFKMTGKMFPNFEMKLWTLQNITKENFPLSYGYIKTLCEFNHHSPFNKFATMTDILRHEALYHYGGFWKDASMHFLKPVLNDFRKYKLAIATDKTLRHRYLQGMCFYGNEKQYPPLLRVTGYQNLNRMRMYMRDPMDIAGPVDFRKIIMGYEQYDPEVLMMSYETFYPGQLGQHPAGDLCTIELQRGEEVKQDLGKYEMIEKGWGVLNNCSSIYPYSFGIEHNRYGVSWLFRQTLKGNRTCIIS